MRRVTIALVLLAIGLAVPVAALVSRALESAAREERDRHESVAARVFDEMELSLTRLLEREEARPFNAYRFYLEKPGDDGAARRSPLSKPAEESYVIGYFQVDPDGSLHTPRRPRAPGPAQARGDFTASPAVDELEASLRERWAALQRAPAVRSSAERPAAEPAAEDDGVSDLADLAARQAFRSEVANALAPQSGAEAESVLRKDEMHTGRDPKLRGSRAGTPEGAVVAPAPEPQEAKKVQSESPYEVLNSLNRGGERRAERRQKVTREKISTLYDAPTGKPRETASRPRRFAGRLESALATDRANEIGASRLEAAEEDAVHAPASRAAPPAARERPKALAESATVRVALDPMVGRPSRDEHLLLYRTVVVGERGYRQGLLIHWPTLGAHLQEEVLEPSHLAESARVAFFGAADLDRNREPDDEYPYVYRHRFAEPFDAFGVEVALHRLAGGRGTGVIHALAGLLALVAAAGLVAIHRMVSVVVQFAERRSRFVAAVSHELKTPLTSIRMYAEMLRDGLVSTEDKRAEYYTTITEESERLSRLIDNVLDFSRLEKGERDVHAVVGEIRPVLEAAVQKLRPHAERQGFGLSFEADETLPTARFDPDVVTQVIFNLVDNALKYGRGAARKEIELRCRALPTGIELSVRDYGPGVPNADLKRIFEPFYRGEDELTRTTRGTGIGLALVKELVEAMDGRIEAANAESGGLRATVHLPASSHAPERGTPDGPPTNGIG